MKKGYGVGLHNPFFQSSLIEIRIHRIGRFAEWTNVKMVDTN